MADKKAAASAAAPEKAEILPVKEPVKAKDMPAEVQAAVEELKEDPEAVLEFKVYPDKVVLVLLDYRKYTFGLGELAGAVKKLAGKK